MKCPKCGDKEVVGIPSSTLPIKNGKYLFTGLKVDSKTLKLHKSIKHICKRCLNEW